MKRMGTSTEQDLNAFHRLLNAVYEAPDSVPGIVCATPGILESTNQSAETVLHWLAVENHVAGIRILHSLGASIPAFALLHAAQAGHVETVALLLALGGQPGRYNLHTEISKPIWRLSDAVKQQLRDAFLHHGFEA